jgi:hypothetical protein
MDRLDLFSILGDGFPRLAGAVLVIALLLCPKLVSSELVSAAREEGRRVSSELEAVLAPEHRRPHAATASPRHPDAKASTTGRR